MLKTFVWSVGELSRLCAVIATILVIAAMLVVCQMILMRYIFVMPTIWQTDFVVFSATAAMFLGAPYVLKTGGHVGVDVVEMAVGPKARHRLRIIGAFLGLCFCMIMLVAGWLQFHDAWEGGWRSSSLWAPPLWVPLMSMPLGFGLLCLQYVAKLIELVTETASQTEEMKPSIGEHV